MASVVITMKIMPTGPEANLDAIEHKAGELIGHYGKVGKVTVVPIAFGLKAIEMMFIMDEAKGSTEELEAKIMDTVPDVNSVEVTDVRRALG